MAQQASNPYLQQLYAAAASPYGQLSPNIMQLMQASTGNPLLDMYQQQYAAAGYPCAAAQVTQPQMCPVTQSLSLDASQANAAMAGRMSYRHTDVIIGIGSNILKDDKKIY